MRIIDWSSDVCSSDLQPVEHLAALRAIPNLKVFRPADTIETAECWELALQSEHCPSVLALTRQNLPTLRRDCAENLSAYGAYIMAPADSERQVPLIASGSEVQIALEAQNLLCDPCDRQCTRLHSTP